MEKYWNHETGKFEPDERVAAFLNDIEAVCRAHGLAISHEDGHGAFIIERLDESLISRLRSAHNAIHKPEPIPPKEYTEEEVREIRRRAVEQFW